MSDPELVEILRASGEHDLLPEAFPLRVFVRVALTLLLAIPVCIALALFLALEALGFLIRSAALAGKSGLVPGSSRELPVETRPSLRARAGVRPAAWPHSEYARPITGAFEIRARAPGDDHARPPND